MNLREFASNSTEFMHSIPQVDRVSKMTMKVLGIGWDIQTDMLYLNVPSTFPDAKTKRHLMQGLLKIYDPIGFVSPVIIRSRLLLQRICQGKGKRWNEALLPSEIEEYRAIIVEYEKFRNIRWPRYFGHEIDQSCQLMCFCDASKQAYATVIYLQKPDGNDRFSSRILFAKSRVCPLKSRMSIPRLELMALLIGVREIKFIREQLAFTGRVVVWSDSQCVLKWMGSNRVQGTFIENRLREIKKVPKLEFKYVPTKDNPADLPSRGVGTDELTEFWWKGPKWSMASESEWPNIEVDVKCSQVKGELEEMSETSPSAGYEVTLAEMSSYQPPYGIDLEKFSTYESCCRFHDHALRRRKESSKQLRPAELRNAEQLWLQFIQVAFSDLRAAMLTNKSHSLRNQLGTAIDSNGIIRCEGRMGAMQGSVDKRFPILLPAKNRFTKLLIERYHKICLHAGKKMTLNTIRRRFWIPHGATSVSQVIKHCVICRKVDGVGFARPQMPDLPSYRVNRTFPFEHTGLDYFGPMSVKESTHEQPTKVWGCIFTCLTTRAIHLELVSSLSADDFLMALRRFISRRGRPRMILCDNGSQFLAVKRKDLKSESTEGSPIKWQVITALSPSPRRYRHRQGGIYERLIALVKSALKKSIGKTMLSKDQLSTLLIEIEYTLNSRPITAVDSDVDIALTPNNLLGVKNVEDTTFEEDDDSYQPERQGVQGKIQSLFKRTRNILNAFWQIWFTDYLNNLRSTQHMRHDDAKGSTRRSPEVGEVVILKDSQLPRNKWKLAIVQDVKRSQDKEIREVKVKLPNGTTLQRPVTLIYPLEIKSTTYKDATVKNSGDKVQTTSTRQDRPTRQAAIQADNNIKLLLQKNLI